MSSATETGDGETARKLSPGLSVVLQSADTDAQTVRLTVDLDAQQHQTLKRMALELGSSASAIVRVLIRLLEDEADVATALLTRLQEAEGN